MAESAHITVLGQKFYLKGTYDTEYLERVEQCLNKKIDEAKRAGGPVDTPSLLILVALNLVDDFLQKESEIEALRKAVESNSERLINLIDSHM